MRIENFTSINPKSFKNVSFELRRGEILGIGGLVGAQRTELVEAIFGLRHISSGKLYINDKMVEEFAEGVHEEQHAVLMASINKYVKHKFILNKKKSLKDIKINIDKLRIKTPSYKTQIQYLSGGNQQKVIFSRWLLMDPDILILDEPTRGIDVGAKYEIYTIIADLAKQGKSIIMISSEMPELIGMSDRIMVMCSGKVSGIIDGKDANQEDIMKLATKFA